MYFKEVKTACHRNTGLWNYDIYGPLMFINENTRQIYANEPDSSGFLETVNNIYTGRLPEEINLANTSVDWAGRRWAMVMLPLSDNIHERLNLITHELFHRSQPFLHFKTRSDNNNHLDKKNGRICLRLELEALKKAIEAADSDEMKQHVRNALIFRAYRHEIYPGSDSLENFLELNEGISEYTGVMMSGRSEAQIKTHFEDRISEFLRGKSFVRSFPYETIPVYGYILSEQDSDWNKKIDGATDLTQFFIKEFDFQIPAELEQAVASIRARYNGNKIISEENQREIENRRRIEYYIRTFITGPHLEIRLENMNFTFDPWSVFPVEDQGTVYPAIRVTDNWGILDVEKEALIGPEFRKISLTCLKNISGNTITGDGWVLELNKGYRIKKGHADGNYYLEKK